MNLPCCSLPYRFRNLLRKVKLLIIVTALGPGGERELPAPGLHGGLRSDPPPLECSGRGPFCSSPGQERKQVRGGTGYGRFDPIRLAHEGGESHDYRTLHICTGLVCCSDWNGFARR